MWARASAVVAATSAGLVALIVGSPAWASPGAAPSPTKILVKLTDSEIDLRPAVIPSGRAVFEVVNRGTRPRDFRIAGARTHAIPAGKSANLPVTFKTAGQNLYRSVGKSGVAQTGMLNVYEPCTSPAATTVNIQLTQAQAGITSSRTSASCGTITFVVSNTGNLVDDLQIFSTFPSVRGATPELQPGQSAKLTLDFPAKGIVHYQSGDYPPGEPEFAGDYNEEGELILD
jgi:hypothetical protein